jgi:hypothetical protein
MKNSESFGLVEQPFDPRDVWADEVLGGSENKLPTSHRIIGLTYEPQGIYPFCVSMVGTLMAEYRYHKLTDEIEAYSQPHLFLHSKGSVRGSTFRNNLNTLKNNGAIPYKEFPIPGIEVYKTGTWLTTLGTKADAIPFTDAKKIAGYARVYAWDSNALKRAILDHGPVMVDVAASDKDYYTNAWHERKLDNLNHAVALVGWLADGRWILFDSLGYVAKSKDWGGEKFSPGYRTVSPRYKFGSAYVITELPEDWKEKVEEARKAPTANENRYNQPRNYPKEVEIANQMLKEFGKFNNQSVTDAAGRFWEMYIRAATYGGYSVSYRKWGRWQPGDIINDCYNWRRTGEHIFDFNKLRSEYK